MSTIVVDVAAGVATLTITAPPANLLSERTFAELASALDRLEAEPAARTVVITGAGEHVFSGGANIAEFAAITEPAGALAVIERGAKAFDRIERFRKPVIAAINGVCAGGACELAIACDLRIMSEAATIGVPEVRLGIVPDWGATARLPQLVGRGRALKLLLTGEMISAAEAYRIGLVEEIVPAPHVLGRALALATALGAQSGAALAGIKRSVAATMSDGTEAGIAAAQAEMKQLVFSDDVKEGVRAFLERRRPNFPGT